MSLNDSTFFPFNSGVRHTRGDNIRCVTRTNNDVHSSGIVSAYSGCNVTVTFARIHLFRRWFVWCGECVDSVSSVVVNNVIFGNNNNPGGSSSSGIGAGTGGGGCVANTRKDNSTHRGTGCHRRETGHGSRGGGWFFSSRGGGWVPVSEDDPISKSFFMFRASIFVRPSTLPNKGRITQCNCN